MNPKSWKEVLFHSAVLIRHSSRSILRINLPHRMNAIELMEFVRDDFPGWETHCAFENIEQL